MKSMLLATAFAGLISASVVAADPLTDQIVSDLTTSGYTHIEIKRSPSQIKVEALRGTEKLEQVWSRSSGDLLKQEVETAGPDDFSDPGVVTRDRSKDPLDDDEVRDDDRDHEMNDDRKDDDDHGDDHDDDHSDDHDDDHGGGHDDDHGDDHGHDDKNDD